jgi:hypothetical protein
MTEAEWGSATLEQIVNWSERPLAVRLGRLLAAGLCRVAGELLPDVVQRTIPTLEMAADADLDRPNLAPELWKSLREFAGADRGGLLTPERELGLAVLDVLRAVDDGVVMCREAASLSSVLTRTTVSLDTGVVCEIARDIFGNPFRPVAFDPAWRTDTAVALAKQMYESRDFSATPILADALQDAGCENEDVLSHCRDANGVHVRGCWVVDLILGKS